MANKRPRRNRNPKTRHRESIPDQSGLNVPKSFGDVLSSPNRTLWMDAMKHERELMDSNHVYDTVENIANPTISKWEFYFKDNVTRARIKVLGSQNYESSPVCTTESVRFLLAMANHLDWSVCRIHCNDAFMHTPLAKPLYVKPPEGTQNRSKVVWKVHKVIYGLRNGSKMLYDRLCLAIKNDGFTQSQYDPCFFFKEGACVCLYADELLVAGNMSLVEKVTQMGYETKTERPARFLGMSLRYNKNSVALSHEDSITEFAERREISKVALAPHSPLSFPSRSLEDSQSPPLDDTQASKYRSLVGSVLHLARTIRFDVFFAACKLASYNKNPQAVHMTQLNRVIQYLLETKRMGIDPAAGTEGTAVYYYSDWVNQMSGYLVSFNGMVISYGFQTEKTRPESREEGDFMAIEAAVKLAKTFTARMDEMWVNHGPIRVLGSNQSTAKILRKGRVNGILPRDEGFHYVKGLGDEVVTEWVSMRANVASVMTRVVRPEVHRKAIEGHLRESNDN